METDNFLKWHKAEMNSKNTESYISHMQQIDFVFLSSLFGNRLQAQSEVTNDIIRVMFWKFRISP